VSTDGGKTYDDNVKITDPSEVLTYNIDVEFPSSMEGYKSVVIEDKLPAQLKYVANSGAITVGGVAPTGGTLSFDDATNTLSYTFADADIAGLAGKTAELTLTATIDGSKLSADAKTTIKNEAKLIVNGNGGPDDPEPPVINVGELKVTYDANGATGGTVPTDANRYQKD
jgi:fimbrial isopeptide formation D2 family protein